MADEPINPQKIIDDATNALGQAAVPPITQKTPVEPQPKTDQPLAEPPAIPPTPPPQPEPLVVPPSDFKPESPPQEVKVPEKKGGKGMLIGMLLFFILTLPVAVYYGSQQFKQITEGRSRAAETGCLNKLTTSPACATWLTTNDCFEFGTSASSCTSTPCCRWVAPAQPTTTPNYTCVSSGYTCVPSSSECRDGGGKEVSKTCANAAWSCCDLTSTLPSCDNVSDCSLNKDDAPNLVHCLNNVKEPTYCCPKETPLYNPSSHTCTKTPGPPSGNWYCNGGTGTVPTNGSCTNGGTYNGKCIIYHCPQGCGGSQCNESSPGVWTELKSCASASLSGNECGQIDTVTDSGTYCSPATGCDVKQLVCNSTCGGGAQPTPPSTQTTSCNECSTNFGCQRAIWTNNGTTCRPADPVGGWTTVQRPTDCSGCPALSQSVIDSIVASGGTANNDACSSCSAPGNFYYVCNESTKQCEQTSIKYPTDAACGAGTY